MSKNGEHGAFAGGLGLTQDGLTKREYFAGVALQGFLAGRRGAVGVSSAADIAVLSVSFADALLEKLQESEASQE